MNYAVFSSDDNQNYSFFLPITSLFWRLLGYRPLLFFVGSADRWLDDKRSRLALERSREVGAVIHFAPEIEGVKTATIAQCVRMFGHAAPGITDDDCLITGDADMLALGPWVGGNQDPAKDLTIWFANAYSAGPCPHDGGRTNPCPDFPFCYIAARASVWRESMHGVTIGDVLAGVPKDDPVLTWNFDEYFLGKRIRAWAGFPERTQFIDRTFVHGEWRLDRSDWDASLARMNGSLDGVADAHLIRPGFTPDNWPRLRPLLEMALSKEHLAWVDDYHSAWMAP